jgi:hypothetical protein
MKSHVQKKNDDNFVSIMENAVEIHHTLFKIFHFPMKFTPFESVIFCEQHAFRKSAVALIVLEKIFNNQHCSFKIPPCFSRVEAVDSKSFKRAMRKLRASCRQIHEALVGRLVIIVNISMRYLLF